MPDSGLSSGGLPQGGIPSAGLTRAGIPGAAIFGVATEAEHRTMRVFSPSIAVLVGVAAVAAVVRVPGLFNDLWYGEIALATLARLATSPMAILVRSGIPDNNYLNALYLHLIRLSIARSASMLPLTRVLALLASFGSLALTPMAMRGQGRTAMLAALLLVGFSTPLIETATDAQGVGPAIFFALATVVAMDSWSRRRWWAALLALQAAAILGFLSHVSFLFVYVPMVGWSVVRLSRYIGWTSGIWSAALCHLPVILIVGSMYLSGIGTLYLHGAETSNWMLVLRDAAGFGLNAPGAGPTAWAALGTISLMATAELVLMHREDDDEWVLFGGIFITTAALTIFAHPSLRHGQYFMICLPFLLLLLARFAARVAQSSPTGQLAAAALVMLFLMGGAVRLERFYVDGRGQYAGAVRYILDKTRGRIVVSSDDDMRTGRMLSFYGAYLSNGRRFQYIPHSSADNNACEWLVIGAGADEEPPTRLRIGLNVFYKQRDRFRTGSEVGADWVVYKRFVGINPREDEPAESGN